MKFSDEKWMEQALALAEKGRPWTSPNPLVGAVIVKNNRFVSSGYHTRYGAPHAEIEAIRKSGTRSVGSTLYVTLEPCSTYGKTPPCTEAITRAGIKRIIIGTEDPNPVHHGRGLSFLAKHKIQITKGVLKKKVLRQNEAFVKWITTGKPFVILKMAQSLDGKIASRTGSSHWISGHKARQWVHHLRSQVDAVLIGKNTLLMDDPRLTVRNGKLTKSPWRIILDSRGESLISARIFKQDGPVILACFEHEIRRVVKKFSSKNITLLPLKQRHGKLDLRQLLDRLGSMGITSLLVEGGGELAGSFIEERLVDQVKWVLAPKIIGGRESKTSVEGIGIDSLSRAHRIKSVEMSQLGEDFLFEGYVS